MWDSHGIHKRTVEAQKYIYKIIYSTSWMNKSYILLANSETFMDITVVRHFLVIQNF